MGFYTAIAEMIIGFGFWLNDEVKKNDIKKVVFFIKGRMVFWPCFTECWIRFSSAY